MGGLISGVGFSTSGPRRLSPSPASVASLRSRLRILLVLGGSVVVAIVAVGTFSFVNLNSARDTVLSVIDPASLAADQLLLAYVNQETAVRGYVLNHDPQFLEPYTSGLRQQRCRTGSMVYGDHSRRVGVVASR